MVPSNSRIWILRFMVFNTLNRLRGFLLLSNLFGTIFKRKRKYLSLAPPSGNFYKPQQTGQGVEINQLLSALVNWNIGIFWWKFTWRNPIRNHNQGFKSTPLPLVPIWYNDYSGCYNPSSIYSWFLKPLSVLHSRFPTKTSWVVAYFKPIHGL